MLGSVGNLRADGDEVTIAGEVRGDAEVRGKSIRIGPEAVVQGDLRWSGPNPPTVLGEVRGASIEVPAGDRGGDAVGMLFWIVSLMLAVMLLFLAMPGRSSRVGVAARTATWRSVGVGLLVLIGTPFLIALSFLVGVLWIVGLLPWRSMRSP